MYKFERLEVWKDSVLLIKHIYELCEALPKGEEFVMANQLKRAVLSISLNIAEGSGSETDVEFKRYLQIAKKSLFETVALLNIIQEIHKVNVEIYIEETMVITKRLTQLIKYFKKA